MKIIQFKENQKEIWNKFIAENNSESFLQSWEWGNFQQVAGKKIFRIGIKDNDEIIAVALIVKHDLPFGRSYLYCPRGPVVAESKIKNQESRIPNILFDEIKKIAKEEKSLFLKIDPPTPLTPTLSRGEREPAPPFEKGAGGISLLRIKKSSNEIQPRNTLILDITKPEEELLKEMKQKTRYNIRLAGKKELRIKSYELRTDNEKFFKEKFEEFWDLIEETSRRDKFASHSKDYYWKILESLSFHGKSNKICHSEFISESINDKGLSCFQFAKQNIERIEIVSGNRQKILKQVQNDNCSCSQKLQAKLYLAEYKNKIIAANIVLYFGDMAVYLHGASSNKYRNLMAPYLLQWQQILDAKKAGCKKYDFWGVTINGKKKSWQGITKFKKGFGGEEKNYIGAYELVFDSIGYRIYGFVKFVKLKVFHFLSSRRSRND